MMTFAASSRNLGCAPSFNLPAHRLEVPLHAVHTDREDVHEAQVLGVLGEHGGERTGPPQTCGAPLGVLRMGG